MFKIEEERTWIIGSLTRYSRALKNQGEDLEKLLCKLEADSNGGTHELTFDSESMLETSKTYMVTRLKLLDMLISVLDEHVAMLRGGDDLDHALASLEYEVYRVKKDVYGGMHEWKALLNQIDIDRLFEINKNPRGPGDLILKDLLWIKNYEEKLDGEK